MKTKISRYFPKDDGVFDPLLMFVVPGGVIISKMRLDREISDVLRMEPLPLRIFHEGVGWSTTLFAEALKLAIYVQFATDVYRSYQ